jgi:Mn2+/Fe2+ NRAMP family transporter
MGTMKKYHHHILHHRLPIANPFRNRMSFTNLQDVGTGIYTRASDDDPSGIATYSQAGAKFGLGMT